MNKLFLTLIILSSGAYASHNGVIYTWGYADITNEILLGVKGVITGIDNFIKSAMAIAFLTFAIKKAMDSRVNPVMEFGKLSLLFVGVSYFFLQAPDDDKHRFVIEDRITGRMHTVSQIPIGIGKTFSLVTQLEDGIAKVMEQHFSLPASANYRQNGFGYPLTTKMNLANVNFTNAYFKRTYFEYISNCVLYDIESGATDIGAITSANDILSALSSQSSRLTIKYTSTNPSGETLQCKEAFTYIQTEIGNQMNSIIKIAAAINGESEISYNNRAGNMSELFFGANENAQSVVKQNVLLKLTQQGFVNSAKASGLDPVALAWGTSLGEMQTINQFTASGLMAKQYLPIMKAMLVAIVIGLSWLIAILAIMFGGYAHIKQFFTLMLWMLFWTPILVIINYLTDFYVSKVTKMVFNETGQKYTLEISPLIDSTISGAIAYAGNMLWLVPLLAYSLVKASEHGFVALSSSMSKMGATGANASGRRVAQMGDPTNTKYSYREGNDIHEDLGGQTASHAGGINNGQSWNATIFKDKKTGIETYSSATPDGSMSLNMVGNQVVSAQSPIALNTAHKNTTTASNELSNAISSSSTNILGNEKILTQAQSQGLSTQDSHNITEAKGIAINKAFEHMQGHGEEFNNLKEMAMKGGINLSTKFLDEQIGVSGGVQYSGVDQNGKKYSWTDTSKNVEENFNQVQEEFSKVVSGNSDYRASYEEMLKVTDNESYSKVQDAMTKLSNAEETETGLNANMLPGFLNNWIHEDERFSRMPKREAAESAMGELNKLLINGENGKISDLVGQYAPNGLEIKSNPSLVEPTKFNAPDLKGQYDKAAGDIQAQTNSTLKQSRENSQEQINRFEQENNKTQSQVEENVEEGKEWGEQGLFSRFWNENGTEMLIGAAGLGATIALTSLGGGKIAKDMAKKIGGGIIDKFKNAKSVGELEDIMKKTDQLDDALKKNSPDVKKLMNGLGLKDIFESDGGSFNKDGSIGQSKLSRNFSDFAKDNVEEFFKNNIYDNIKNSDLFDDAKKFVGESLDDAWKGVKNINPRAFVSGAADLAKGGAVGLLMTSTELGGKTYYDDTGKAIDTSMFSGTQFDNQGVPKNAVAWSSPDQPMVPIKENGGSLEQVRSFYQQQNQNMSNGQSGFNLVDKNDTLGKQVNDLQIQIKQLQKASPSSQIPGGNTKEGAKGEVL